MNRLRAAVLGLMAFLALGTTSVSPQSFNEYQLKAVFLFNFAQFVEWSTPALGDPHAPFSICVLGEDPFNEILDDTVRGESIDTHHFEIRRFREPSDAANCQILYVSSSELRRLRGILDSLKGRAILTVSDADNFARRGGMVQFLTENKRIKLAINVDAARAANLTISSKLLRPATIVSSSKD